MLLSWGGNVGINVASPTARLAVDGNAVITGNVGIGVVNPTVKLAVNGKVSSASTASSDPADTLTTKDYVDARAAKGTIVAGCSAQYYYAGWKQDCWGGANAMCNEQLADDNPDNDGIKTCGSWGCPVGSTGRKMGPGGVLCIKD